MLCISLTATKCLTSCHSNLPGFRSELCFSYGSQIDEHTFSISIFCCRADFMLSLKQHHIPTLSHSHHSDGQYDVVILECCSSCTPDVTGVTKKIPLSIPQNIIPKVLEVFFLANEPNLSSNHGIVKSEIICGKWGPQLLRCSYRWIT